jgi:hypothetical protein
MLEANNGAQGIEEFTNPEMLKVAAYICWVVAALSILALCCSLRKIRIAAAVIRAAAEFSRQECKIIIVPFFMFLVIVPPPPFRPSSWCSGSPPPSTSSAAGRSPNAHARPMPASIGMWESNAASASSSLGSSGTPSNIQELRGRHRPLPIHHRLHRRILVFFTSWQCHLPPRQEHLPRFHLPAGIPHFWRVGALRDVDAADHAGSAGVYRQVAHRLRQPGFKCLLRLLPQVREVLPGLL